MSRFFLKAGAGGSAPVDPVDDPIINTPPIAEYSFLADGLAVAFDSNASSDNDGVIVSRQFNFGDGEKSSEIAPTHNYPDVLVNRIWASRLEGVAGSSVIGTEHGDDFDVLVGSPIIDGAKNFVGVDGSIYFDGASACSDGSDGANSPVLGAGEFSIEGFFESDGYPINDNGSRRHGLMGTWRRGNGTGGWQLFIFANTDTNMQKLIFYVNDPTDANSVDGGDYFDFVFNFQPNTKYFYKLYRDSESMLHFEVDAVAVAESYFYDKDISGVQSPLTLGKMYSALNGGNTTSANFQFFTKGWMSNTAIYVGGNNPSTIGKVPTSPLLKSDGGIVYYDTSLTVTDDGGLSHTVNKSVGVAVSGAGAPVESASLLASYTVAHVKFNGQATVGIRFNDDGTIDRLKGVNYSRIGEWYSGAPVAGIGAGYEIQAFNSDSGAALDVGVFDAYSVINGNEWKFSSFEQGYEKIEFDVRIKEAGGVVLATSDISLSAEGGTL